MKTILYPRSDQLHFNSTFGPQLMERTHELDDRKQSWAFAVLNNRKCPALIARQHMLICYIRQIAAYDNYAISPSLMVNCIILQRWVFR